MDVSPAEPQHRVTLDGEYDLTRKEEIAVLFAALDISEPVHVDLTNVTYMDSTVLHELAALRLRCDDITLAGPSDNIRRILHLTHLDKLFHITDPS